MIAITLGSKQYWLAHWLSTEEIHGSNPFDCKFLSSQSMNSSTTYCGTRMHSSRMRTARMLRYWGGISLTEIPWTENSLDRDPHTETPWTETFFLDRDSPPGQRSPPPWTESQTGVKTLPCRNFVAGYKNSNNCNGGFLVQAVELPNILITLSLSCEFRTSLQDCTFWIARVPFEFEFECNRLYDNSATVCQRGTIWKIESNRVFP